MSPITKEFTKEQLQQIIETDHVQCGEASALARIALASLEAEAVAWLLSGGGAKNNVSFDSGNAYADPLREVTPLYTAPPAPVSMKDHQIRELVNELRDIAVEYYGTQQLRERIARTVRAAMLQGADGNSPVIPDGWVMVPAEPTEAMMNAWLSEVANWRGHAAGYRAMIAAAPQQEVK